MYPFTPVLQWFRGPHVVVIDILGVRGTFFKLLGVYGAEKVKNHCNTGFPRYVLMQFKNWSEITRQKLTFYLIKYFLKKCSNSHLYHSTYMHIR